jgi:hypothetical protein
LYLSLALPAFGVSESEESSLLGAWGFDFIFTMSL